MLTNEEILSTLQEWNFWEKDQETGFEREFELAKIKSLIKVKEIIDVIGVRRCGKSTLLKQIIKNLIDQGTNRKEILYVNFEEERFEPFLSLELLRKIYQVYEHYIYPKPKYLFLDEINVIPRWEKWVRTVYEKSSGKIKIFVSGSSAHLLKSEVSSVLTGRHLTFELFPLSFREFLLFKGLKIKNEKDILLKSKEIKRHLLDYLFGGGFPEAVLDKPKRKKLLKSYFNDIIYRDIVERYKVREVAQLKNVALLLLTNVSSLFTYNKLAKSLLTKISVESAARFVNYLEESFLLFTTKIFSYKVKEQLQYPQKVYSVDSGLRNEVSFRFIRDLSKLYENAVALELKRREKEIYYWQNPEKKEVDFVIKKGLKVKELIQVSYDLSRKETREKEITALIKAMEEFKLNRALVITHEYEGKEKIDGKNIYFIPLWKWLLLF